MARPFPRPDQQILQHLEMTDAFACAPKHMTLRASPGGGRLEVLQRPPWVAPRIVGCVSGDDVAGPVPFRDRHVPVGGCGRLLVGVGGVGWSWPPVRETPASPPRAARGRRLRRSMATAPVMYAAWIRSGTTARTSNRAMSGR